MNPAFGRPFGKLLKLHSLPRGFAQWISSYSLLMWSFPSSLMMSVSPFGPRITRRGALLLFCVIMWFLDHGGEGNLKSVTCTVILTLDTCFVFNSVMRVRVFCWILNAIQLFLWCLFFCDETKMYSFEQVAVLPMHFLFRIRWKTNKKISRSRAQIILICHWNLFRQYTIKKLPSCTSISNLNQKPSGYNDDPLM